MISLKNVITTQLDEQTLQTIGIVERLCGNKHEESRQLKYDFSNALAQNSMSLGREDVE